MDPNVKLQEDVRLKIHTMWTNITVLGMAWLSVVGAVLLYVLA